MLVPPRLVHTCWIWVREMPQHHSRGPTPSGLPVPGDKRTKHSLIPPAFTEHLLCAGLEAPSLGVRVSQLSTCLPSVCLGEQDALPVSPALCSPGGKGSPRPGWPGLSGAV